MVCKPKATETIVMPSLEKVSTQDSGGSNATRCRRYKTVLERYEGTHSYTFTIVVRCFFIYVYNGNLYL